MTEPDILWKDGTKYVRADIAWRHRRAAETAEATLNAVALAVGVAQEHEGQVERASDDRLLEELTVIQRRAGRVLEVEHALEVAEAKVATAEKDADARWNAALEAADWDGGVFHYDGRIYPWPRGFVPDCPATWASKTAPLEAALETAERRVAALEDAGRALVQGLDEAWPSVQVGR